MFDPCVIGLKHQAAGPKGVPFVRLQVGARGVFASRIHDPVLLIEGGQTSR